MFKCGIALSVPSAETILLDFQSKLWWKSNIFEPISVGVVLALDINAINLQATLLSGFTSGF